MAAHASKQGDSLNLRPRRGKRHHSGGDVYGIVVLGLTVLSLLFILYESHETGVFVPVKTLKQLSCSQHYPYGHIHEPTFLMSFVLG